MGKLSRTKGKVFELAVCKLLSLVFPGLERTCNQGRQGAKSPDVDYPIGDPRGCCPVRIEASHSKGPSPHTKYAQAERDAKATGDDRPIIVVTKKDRGLTLVTMHVADYVALVKQAGGVPSYDAFNAPVCHREATEAHGLDGDSRCGMNAPQKSNQSPSVGTTKEG